MASAILIENLCGGMGTAAFVALMMALTDKRFSAAQYALLSALAAIGRVYVGPASGVMVEAFGWPVFFLWSIAAAIPGLALLMWLKKDVDDLPGAMPTTLHPR
jgi:MFS transporter, PAT family, beta-lactamase induction signal transducer AmpG